MIHQARFKRGATPVSNSNEFDPKSHGNSTAVVSNVEFNPVAPNSKYRKRCSQAQESHNTYNIHFIFYELSSARQ